MIDFIMERIRFVCVQCAVMGFVVCVMICLLSEKSYILLAINFALLIPNVWLLMWKIGTIKKFLSEMEATNEQQAEKD